MTLIKRIILAGLQGFYRNRTISISSIFILVITLSIICNLFVAEAVFRSSVDEINKKVNITIHLRSDATDISILNIKNKLASLSEVKEVNYVSREDTLNNFKEQYAGDEATIASLAEVGDNPFGASFSVVAKETHLYDSIASKINNDKVFGQDQAAVDKISYLDVKDSIYKLNYIIRAIEGFGIFAIIVFVAMSIMIIYNTVVLAIFSFREEISIMKLVGASDSYIRGPFVVESGIYALVATLVSMILMYPLFSWIREKSVDFLGGFDVLNYYTSHLPHIFLLLFLSGITVSIASSMLAVRKYLRV